MIIAIDVLFSLLMIAVGYCIVCNYLKDRRLFSKDFNTLTLTRNRILYLIATLVVCGVLIALFKAIYRTDLITQLKLLSLVLIIFPTAVIDYRLHKIPNQFILVALIFRLAFYIFEFALSFTLAFATLKDNLIGAIVIGLFFLLLLLIYKNSIGMGDVKLFAVIGLYQGLWGGVNSVFFSLITSFVISIILLITKKKKRKDSISFAPSILIGTIIAISLSGM